MSLLIKEEERTQKEWNRKARDAVNAMIRRVLGVGVTAERPTNPTDGQMFYDRTLKIPVWFNAADGNWKNAAGTAV